MSRIGKKEIIIPENVKVENSDGLITVSGPLGVLTVSTRDEVEIKINGNTLVVERKNDSKFARSLHGLTRTLIANAIYGVVEQFKKELEIVGVGYRAQVEDGMLKLKIGYSHEVEVKPKEGIVFEVKKNIISISGCDKQLVGQTAAEIRALKKPEPYKGKGIKYLGEKIIRKVGKAVKGAGTGV